MNYAGKFDGAISSEGPGAHSHFAHLNPGHVHAPADSIVVPDAHFLFNADFKRSGVDLILSGDDRELVLHDYFKGTNHKALASPDGAHLTGHMVDALTGHVEIAQAGGGTAAASAVIGHVTKLAGSATVIRNGVSVILNNGDNVEKGDVVQSGSNSTVGITFIDGTVFGLSSNARMVLNEMVYDPNGSNNSSLMSLVAGTITFVAGETAKHGDMKIDTPVATMGIRGTAVLVEIDFSVPGANGQPNASFQVLVEPDGTTGSYILFDKATMQPLAIVNQAGQQININNGVISQTQNPLTPQMQQLINEVFSQKFTDNNTTKSTTTIGSSTPDGTTALVKYADSSQQQTSHQGTGTGSTDGTTPGNGPTGQGTVHVPGAPIVNTITAFFVAEIPGKTNVGTLDQIKFPVGFSDINPGDQPSAKADFNSFTYKDAHGHDVTASLSTLQKADIAATEIALALTPNQNNTNNGSTDILYSLADKNFDFLAAGEELTLIYTISVNTNYGPDPEVTNVQVTLTIIGTNDQPIIATDTQPQLIHFAAGTSTKGGTLVSTDATSGTFAFKDPDLTDTHWIVDPNKDPNINANANPTDPHRYDAIQKGVLTSASMAGPNGTLDLAGLDALAPGPMSVFAQALDVNVSTDSTGTGNGQISWQLKNLPVFLADFIPAGETLKLFYTIEVTDEQGSTDTQIVEVDITGTNAAATVWIHTTTDGNDNNWTTGANWGTGKAPTSVDDVIIVTDQLHPNTPAYPATITAGTNAAAHSVVMNDFIASPGDNIPPILEVDGSASLTIGTDFDLSANSILTNAGTVTVDGKFELLDDATNPVTHVNKSVVTNSGTIKIGQGGDIQGLASVTNSGTIELQGGTLNLDVNVTNSANGSGGSIQVDSGAKLVLGTDSNPNLATPARGGVTGGGVTVNSGGELDLTGGNTLAAGALVNNGKVSVTGASNTLDAETVFNTGNATAIDITGALTLKDGSTILNETAASGETVESGASLTLQGSGIQDGEVTNKGTLNLGSSGLSNGTLANTGQVNISGPNNGLSGETVFNTGNGSAIDITGALTLTNATTITNTDGTSGETIESGGNLTLWDTSSIFGGTVTNAGTLTFEGGSLTSGTLANTGEIDVVGKGSLSGETVTANNKMEVFAGNTLTIDQGSFVTNTGTIKVDAGAYLRVNDTTIDGGLIAANGLEWFTGSVVLQNGTLQGPDSSASDVFIEGAANAFHKETVTDAILDLANGTGAELTIDLGSVVDNTEIIVSSGTLTLNDVTFQNGSVIANDSAGGTVDLTGQVLLKDGAVRNALNFDVSGTGNVFDNETVENELSGAIDITGALTVKNGTAFTNTMTSSETVESGGTLTLQDTSSITGGKLVNLGTVNIEQSTGAALDNVSVTGGGTINVDANAPSTPPATLILKNGTSITDGSIEVGSVGTLEVSGGGASLTGVTVDVTSGGVVRADSGDTLTLNGTTINNGTVTNAGTINSTGGVDIKDANIGNTGTIESTAGKLTIDGTTSGSGPSQTFTLTNSNMVKADGGQLYIIDEQVANTGTLEAINGGTLKLSSLTVTNTAGTVSDTSGATIDLASATINGGTVTNGGMLNSMATSGIHGATIGNSGTLESTGGTLTIDATSTATTLTNTGTVKADGAELDITTESVDNSSATSLLEAINNGTLKLTSTTVTNTAGTVSDTSGATIDLSGATINGGTVTNAGTLNSTATSGIHGATIGNSGTLESTGGTLTIDATSTATTLTNTGTVKADGAELDITTESIGNSSSTSLLEAINGGTLKLSSLTVTNTAGTVSDTSGATIDLASATINGGTVTNGGTLNSTATSGIHGATIGNSGTLESTGGTLTIDATSTATTLTNTGTVKADGAELDITTESIDNSSATSLLEAVNTGTLKLTSTTVTNTAGTVSDTSGATIDLASATINGGTVTNAGTLNSTATSGIHGATIGNSGTLESTGGTLTIDATSTATTLTNTGTVKADGAELDITTESIGNSSSTSLLEAINGGTLKLSSLTVTNTAGTVSDTSGATIDLASATINGGTVTNGGTLNSTATSGIHGATIGNSGTLESTGGTLTIDATSTAMTLTNTGTVKADGAELDITTESIDNSSATSLLEAVNNGTLKLSSLTVTNTAGTVSDTSGATIDLASANISGGAVTNAGTLNLKGTSALSSGLLANSGTLNVSGSGNALDGETVTANNMLEVLVGAALTLDQGTSVANASGTVQVDATATLTLNDASITGGTVTNAGTINSKAGGGAIDQANIGNTGTIESTAGKLTIDGTTSGSGPSQTFTLTNSNMVKADGGQLYIIDEQVANTGTLEAINSGTLQLTGLTVDNTDPLGNHDGTVSVADGTSELDLSNAEIDGGTVTNAGTIDSTGGGKIEHADITNTGTIEFDRRHHDDRWHDQRQRADLHADQFEHCQGRRRPALYHRRACREHRHAGGDR